MEDVQWDEAHVDINDGETRDVTVKGKKRTAEVVFEGWELLGYARPVGGVRKRTSSGKINKPVGKARRPPATLHYGKGSHQLAVKTSKAGERTFSIELNKGLEKPSVGPEGGAMYQQPGGIISWEVFPQDMNW